MSGKKQASTTRREFLKGGVRLAVAAGLTAAGGMLLQRKSSVLPGENCTGSFICRACSASAGCPLPQALSFRTVASQNRQEP